MLACTQNCRRIVGLTFAFAAMVLAPGCAGGADAPEGAIGTQSSALTGGIYSTSFEQPTFTAGAQLLGIDGWSTAIPPFLNPSAATITADAARPGRQSVQIPGASLIGSEGITAPYDAVGSYRHPVNYTVTSDRPRVVLEANLELDTEKQPTGGEFFSVTIAARSGDGETLGEVGLSSAGVAEAWTFDASPGDAPALVAPAKLSRWHRIKMVLDFANRTTSYYVDGERLGTVNAPSASSVLSRGAIVTYAKPDGGGNARADYTARADDFEIRARSAGDDD